MIITIDGPTASGKSATAQRLAQRLGFFYLNSGFLYRALAYLLMRDKHYTLEALYAPSEDDTRIVLDPTKLIYTCDAQGNPHIAFDGADITAYLKGSPTIDQASRDIALKHDIVIDGRDTGTVVFPQADFKFYLTAPLEIRADRWMKEQAARGNKISFEQACKELAMRDERDMTRAIAPLVIPQDAHIIDNGLYSIDETVNLFYSTIK